MFTYPLKCSIMYHWKHNSRCISFINIRKYLYWYFIFFFSFFFIELMVSELSVQFNSVQSLSRVWLFATPWIAAHQASLSIINSRSSLKLTSIDAYLWPGTVSSTIHVLGSCGERGSLAGRMGHLLTCPPIHLPICPPILPGIHPPNQPSTQPASHSPAHSAAEPTIHLSLYPPNIVY